MKNLLIAFALIVAFAPPGRRREFPQRLQLPLNPES